MEDKNYNGYGILQLYVEGCYVSYMLWGLVVRSYSGKYLYELYG
jgi:hypothetical protein